MNIFFPGTRICSRISPHNYYHSSIHTSITEIIKGVSSNI